MPGLFQAKRATAEKKSSKATGSTKVSAQAAKVLARLREAGENAEGMTAEMLIYALQLPGDTKQVRKVIRQAQEIAVKDDDLVFVERTWASVDRQGNPVRLNNGANLYFIVPSTLAATASAEDLNEVRDSAKDFCYNGEVSDMTRSDLAIKARDFYASRQPRKVLTRAEQDRLEAAEQERLGLEVGEEVPEEQAPVKKAPAKKGPESS